jgi:hypothetical protein
VDDPNSFTHAEIIAHTNWSDKQWRDMKKRKLESGEWEMVFKRVDGVLRRSYRLGKKPLDKKA